MEGDGPAPGSNGLGPGLCRACAVLTASPPTQPPPPAAPDCLGGGRLFALNPARNGRRGVGDHELDQLGFAAASTSALIPSLSLTLNSFAHPFFLLHFFPPPPPHHTHQHERTAPLLRPAAPSGLPRWSPACGVSPGVVAQPRRAVPVPAPRPGSGPGSGPSTLPAAVPGLPGAASGPASRRAVPTSPGWPARTVPASPGGSARAVPQPALPRIRPAAPSGRRVRATTPSSWRVWPTAPRSRPVRRTTPRSGAISPARPVRCAASIWPAACCVWPATRAGLPRK